MKSEAKSAEGETVIWQKDPDDPYSPKIINVKNEAIAINIGGKVFQKPVEKWFEMAELLSVAFTTFELDKVAKELYQKAALQWGEEAQVIQALEELSELSKALCKFWRDDSGSCLSVAEEIADVEIMIGQLKALLPNRCINYFTRKLARLKIKLDTGEWIDWESITVHEALKILFDEKEAKL